MNIEKFKEFLDLHTIVLSDDLAVRWYHWHDTLNELRKINRNVEFRVEDDPELGKQKIIFYLKEEQMENQVSSANRTDSTKEDRPGGQIPKQFSALSKALVRVEDGVAMLEERIKFILGPVEERPSPPVKDPTGSEILQGLCSLEYLALETVERINGIADRIEL